MPEWARLGDLRPGDVFQTDRQCGVVIHRGYGETVCRLDGGPQCRLSHETVVQEIDVALLLARDAEVARLLHDKGLDGASAWEERGWRKGVAAAAQHLEEMHFITYDVLRRAASELRRLAPPPVPLAPDEAAAEIAELRKLLADVVSAGDLMLTKGLHPARHALDTAIDAVRKHLGGTP